MRRVLIQTRLRMLADLAGFVGLLAGGQFLIHAAAAFVASAPSL